MKSTVFGVIAEFVESFLI